MKSPQANNQTQKALATPQFSPKLHIFSSILNSQKTYSDVIMSCQAGENKGAPPCSKNSSLNYHLDLENHHYKGPYPKTSAVPNENNFKMTGIAMSLHK